MSSDHEEMIWGVPRRPRLAKASDAAILAAIALGILTGGWGGAILGGLAGGAWANQRQPLEMAIREYFKQLNYEVAFIYRAPRAVKVTFRYGTNAFWTVESVIPDHLQPSSPEDAEDWLYGNLITAELPKFQARLKRAS